LSATGGRRVAPPPAVVWQPLLPALSLSALTRLRLRLAAGILLLLPLTVLVVTGLAVTGLTLPRLPLTLATLLHGAHR
jgi:hypothetical protein